MTKEKIAIVSFDHTKRNIPLQPWKYIHEMAKFIKERGDEVIVVTNADVVDEAEIEGIEIKNLAKISPFSDEIEVFLKSYKPTIIYWWASLRTIAYNKLFSRLNYPINLLYTGSIYYNSEILPVIGKIGKNNFKTYLPELIVPHSYTRKLVSAPYVNKVITLSHRNKERLIKIGADGGKIFVTGIGKDVTGFEVEMLSNERNQNQLLYITSATKIRGIEFLLRALASMVKKRPYVRLRVLARPSSGNNSQRVLSLAKQLGIEKNVDLVEGWLSKKEILHELSACRVLVMPFLLVHSEMPVSILEAFSVATPVIAPDLDGVTELVQQRGIIYKPNSGKDLISAIEKIMDDKEQYNSYSQNALSFWRERPLWADLFGYTDI
jgi:phosphatidylinositol alpha-1,6-mannosyltransferase